MANAINCIPVFTGLTCDCRKKRQIETDSSGVKLSVVPNVNNEARYSEVEIDNRLYAELVKPGPEDYSRTYDRLAT